MSGGHFNHNSYIYYRVYQFADELDNEIERNNTKDEWGYAPELSEETLNYLRQKVVELRKISEVMRHIDYLYSGDYSEESFMERMKESNEKIL
jgi:hypothetical protein